eukprot:m.135643 g.135643  ORF g.135643 m.135643 type:complete len:476 (-) comp22613_c0_seq1:237-1664(-)
MQPRSPAELVFLPRAWERAALRPISTVADELTRVRELEGPAFEVWVRVNKIHCEHHVPALVEADIAIALEDELHGLRTTDLRVAIRLRGPHWAAALSVNDDVAVGCLREQLVHAVSGTQHNGTVALLNHDWRSRLKHVWALSMVVLRVCRPLLLHQALERLLSAGGVVFRESGFLELLPRGRPGVMRREVVHVPTVPECLDRRLDLGYQRVNVLRAHHRIGVPRPGHRLGAVEHRQEAIDHGDQSRAAGDLHPAAHGDPACKHPGPQRCDVAGKVGVQHVLDGVEVPAGPGEVGVEPRVELHQPLETALVPDVRHVRDPVQSGERAPVAYRHLEHRGGLHRHRLEPVGVVVDPVGHHHEVTPEHHRHHVHRGVERAVVPALHVEHHQPLAVGLLHDRVVDALCHRTIRVPGLERPGLPDEVSREGGLAAASIPDENDHRDLGPPRDPAERRTGWHRDGALPSVEGEQLAVRLHCV